jgi:hypothetical protein
MLKSKFQKLFFGKSTSSAQENTKKKVFLKKPFQPTRFFRFPRYRASAPKNQKITFGKELVQRRQSEFWSRCSVCN